jgi:hypothetical protein
LNESVGQRLIGLRNEIVELTNLLKRTVLYPEQANVSEIIKKIFRESKQFPPLVKKVMVTSVVFGDKRKMEIEVPEGMIAHLTRECGGNVHDRHVVEVTCGSFEKETVGDNPHSGPVKNDPKFAAKNAADLETDSRFHSAYRSPSEHISHTRNNWVCHYFKERMVVPTHYTIRTNWNDPGPVLVAVKYVRTRP